jgi:hypothetical protein
MRRAAEGENGDAPPQESKSGGLVTLLNLLYQGRRWSKNEKIVGTAIGRRMGAGFFCWPSVASLVFDSGLNRSAIHSALNGLCGKAGILDRVRCGAGRSNCYVVRGQALPQDHRKRKHREEQPSERPSRWLDSIPAPKAPFSWYGTVRKRRDRPAPERVRPSQLKEIMAELRRSGHLPTEHKVPGDV